MRRHSAIAGITPDILQDPVTRSEGRRGERVRGAPGAQGHLKAFYREGATDGRERASGRGRRRWGKPAKLRGCGQTRKPNTWDEPETKTRLHKPGAPPAVRRFKCGDNPVVGCSTWLPTWLPSRSLAAWFHLRFNAMLRAVAGSLNHDRFARMQESCERRRENRMKRPV